ncbi:MAG: hypothetical protein M3285_01000 [Actinomycetota bacterium]|nr:hypothetical protein [Actinomycetota bacterium]MDQ3954113.1 hypothetical protein [Actinomycetota bacterium]
MSVDWSPPLDEIAATLISVAASGGIMTIWLQRSLFGEPIRWPARGFTETEELQVIGWERDRIMSAAKGLAGSASAFLAALAIALLKDEVKVSLSAWTLIGLVAGLAGCLLLAGRLATASRELVEAEIQ